MSWYPKVKQKPSAVRVRALEVFSPRRLHAITFNVYQDPVPAHPNYLVIFENFVFAGNAQWLDNVKQQCLILWKKMGEWADTLYSFAREFGLQGSVMTLDELSSGDEVRGTGESEGRHHVILNACRCEVL
jgi:hypothetical protein